MRKGSHHSPEARRKISAVQTGRIQSPELRARRSAALMGRKVSAETRDKIGLANRGRTPWSKGKILGPQQRGWHHSAETIAKMTGLKRSAESRARMSAIRTGKPGHPISDATRAALKAALSGIPKTREHVAKVAAAQRGQKRGPLPAAHRAAISAALIGKPRSPETIEKIRQANLGRKSVFFGRPQMNPEGRGHRTLYAGISFRSTYEARFAKALDSRGIGWRYEPKRFDLGSCTYLPDFFIPETGAFWEIKGWHNASSQMKARLFRELYPEHPLIIATHDVITMMEGSTNGSRHVEVIRSPGLVAQ